MRDAMSKFSKYAAMLGSIKTPKKQTQVVSMEDLEEDQKRNPFRKHFVERFWSKIEKGNPNECWKWTAALHVGYGWFLFRRGSPYGGTW